MTTRTDVYIGGTWTPSTSEREIVVRSPATGEPVGRVPDAGAADVDAAVAAARRAFDTGPWPAMAPAERAEVMQALLTELSARSDEMARTIMAENGTPAMLIGPGQVDNALDVLRYYAEVAASLETETPRAGRYSPALVRTDPVGVVAAVVPWNVPFFLTMMKVAPAMAAGCTLVLKAAPETPLNAYLLAEAAHAAGVPAGVLNVLAAGPESSERLVTHADVDKVAFTGSTAVGKRIAGLAAAQLKRVTLELGGKSAAIVLADADLTTTMPRLVGVTMSLSGQFCIAQSRVLVPRDRYDEAVELFAAAVEKLPVGDPADPATFIGPVISERQRDRILGYIEIGRAEGAVVVTGGGVPEGLDRGWYVAPTVFRDVTPGMRIAQEEIFGPVVALLPYDDEDDAVAIANDSDFGLHGTVWTPDVAHGVEIARRVRTGTYSVNGLSLDPAAPFGGVKQSGLGRELGPEGLAAYQESRTITVPVGTALPGLA
ncbi:aldehyde dehydrogenase [Trujillonella endophytica]|uniref:Betaine-aldehyde dehydrogenase n=1 Tax=Trujillonella endophytica TaxID=673521 RepID=A0A1H8T6Z5_9ACTN|nr:aldehyde dehydrogenase [Trujillella endophytica]SEO86615.1 betaine-aldehyde dehydrogenase [Trujillella endophytica]